MILPAQRAILMRQRPFKTRNADEYNLSDVLALFVDPVAGTKSPFDYENTIVKGRMGSGKTMYLRANQAYHQFNIIPRLLAETEVILPVFVKLNDFQHIKNPQEIYRHIVISIATGISEIYDRLIDSEHMSRIHFGMKKLPVDLLYHEKSRERGEQLLRMRSDEYTESIQNEISGKAGIKTNYVELFAEVKKFITLDLKKKSNPGIRDIETIYKILLGDKNGKILLLLDEAGALDKDFFSEQNGDALFEILMNQFRTADYIRTKIAVYPNSYSDLLTEVRYGDVVNLEENIHDHKSFLRIRKKVNALIENYLNVNEEKERVGCHDLFSEQTHLGDAIEQVINGSGGNYRRLIQLLDASLDACFTRAQGEELVSYDDVVYALSRQAEEMLRLFIDTEIDFLDNLSRACKTRGTYKFKFPNNTSIYKYLSKSKEFNIIKVVAPGSGRRSTVYAFDYAHCVLKEIPTHHLRGTERIDKTRSLASGDWIEKITTISAELIRHASIQGKVEGEIEWVQNNFGFIRGDDAVQYFFNTASIITADAGEHVRVKRRVRFLPSVVDGHEFASEIELP